MPVVPYRPFPSVEPAVEPTPRIGLSVPSEAFGGAVGQALSGLGRTLGEVGNETERTAIQIQSLQNDTWAKDADTEAMVKIGKLDSEFKQTEGQNTVSALDSHQKAIVQVRKEALDGAPNEFAKKLLNNTLSRRVGFALIDAGNYAGTQAKVAANNASSARLKAAQETFDPQAPALGLKTIEAEVRHQGQVHGAEEDTVSEGLNKAKSTAWLNGLTKMAPNDPEKARDIFEKVKDSLDPQVREQLQTTVNRNMAIHQTRDQADDILKDLNPADPKGLTEYLDKAKKVAQEKGGDNPDYGDYLENRVRAKYNLAQAGYRDAQLQNKNTVEGFIMGKGPGDKIVSIDGIAGPQAPEDVRNAYIALSPDKKRSVEAFIAKESKLATPYTPERQARYSELLGLSHTDPEKFAELSVLNEDLPRGKIDDLFKRQLAIKDKAQPDTDLAKYLSQARPALLAAGIGPSAADEGKAQTYLQFIGGFEQAINEWKGDHGKPPNDKEIRTITQDLLTKVVTSKGFVWDTKERRFEVEVPQEHKDAIERAFQQIHGRAPSEDEVRSSYLRKMHFPTVQ